MERDYLSSDYNKTIDYRDSKIRYDKHINKAVEN